MAHALRASRGGVTGDAGFGARPPFHPPDPLRTERPTTTVVAACVTAASSMDVTLVVRAGGGRAREARFASTSTIPHIAMYRKLRRDNRNDAMRQRLIGSLVQITARTDGYMRSSYTVALSQKKNYSKDSNGGEKK